MADVVISGSDGGIVIDAPNNSNKKKREVKQVVTDVTVKKESLAKKVLSEFIQCDLNTVAQDALHNIIIPYVKDAILDCLHDGVDMIFGGKPRAGRRGSYSRSSGATYVNYGGFYQNDRKEEKQEKRPERNSNYQFKECIFRTRIEAEEVIENMIDILEVDGSVTVGDFYSLVGIKPAYTDEKYGWTNLKTAVPVRVRGDGYAINLPRPILL